MKRIFLIALLVAAVVVGVVSCKKNNLVVDKDPLTPPAMSEFAYYNASFAKSFAVQQTAPYNKFKIPVGITNLGSTDRTVQFTYTSTNATNGVQYTAPTSLTIKAGQALDSLPITGNFANLTSGTSYVVKIKITGGDVPAFQGKDSVLLTIRKFCPVVPTASLGAYANTNELFGTSAYGPYTTTISQVKPTVGSTTKDTITVTNIWDYGWNPIRFVRDYSSADPSGYTITVVPQSTGIADAGTISATYAGYQVAVRAHATGGNGTFDECTNTQTLVMQLGIAQPNGTIVGWYSQVYTVTMKR